MKVERHPMVRNNMVLNPDGKCDTEGHDLIPRACIHCGLTIHQIADVNDGRLPMRDTPQNTRDTIRLTKGRLKHAQNMAAEAKKSVADIEKHLAKLEEKENA